MQGPGRSELCGTNGGTEDGPQSTPAGHKSRSAIRATAQSSRATAAAREGADPAERAVGVGVGVACARPRARSFGSAARRLRPRRRRLLRRVLGSLREAQAPWTSPPPGLCSLWARHGYRAEAFPPGGVRRVWLYGPVCDRGGGPGAGGPGGELPPALGRGRPFPGEAAGSAGEGCPEAG